MAPSLLRSRCSARRWAIPVAVVAFLSGPGTASASALRVTPIRVEVAPDKRFCALNLANDSEGPVSVQVRGYRWSRDGGTDKLEPAPGFTINPTIVTLGNGETRLVRCSLPPPEGSDEQTWRLILDELNTSDTVSAPGEIRTLLRISVPVFRAPAGARAELDWAERDSETGEGRMLTIGNRGGRHVRVGGIDFTTASGQKVHLDRGGYILARGRLDVPLPPSHAAITEVQVETDQGPLAVIRRGTAAGVIR